MAHKRNVRPGATARAQRQQRAGEREKKHAIWRQRAQRLGGGQQ